MVKRMVEPDPLDRVKLMIQSSIDRFLYNPKCRKIANIGVRRITIEISGELIEQDHQSQRASRCAVPFVEGTGASAGYELPEPGANLFIDRLPSTVPPIEPRECGLGSIKAWPKPESNDVGGKIASQRQYQT